MPVIVFSLAASKSFIVTENAARFFITHSLNAPMFTATILLCEQSESVARKLLNAAPYMPSSDACRRLTFGVAMLAGLRRSARLLILDA